MKNKKGFTLVELLAVIAILAILVIIALPNVINMYNRAQKETFLTEAKKVYSEAEKKYISSSITGNVVKTISSEDNSKLDMTGEKLQYCVILNNSGKVTDIKVSNGKWIASLTDSKTIDELTIDDLEEGNLDGYKCSINASKVPKPTICTFGGDMVQGAEYVNGQYTYRYKQGGSYSNNGLEWSSIGNDGWGVQLTDRTSTDAVTSKVCTYINNKPVVFMAYMFDGSQATSLDLSSFNTSNVTNMRYMFAGVQTNNIDLSKFDTGNVTTMEGMFLNVQLTTLDLSSFDTSNVINMGWMFQDTKINELDLSNFDTSNVTNMGDMFNRSETKIIDLSSFNTSKVTNMAYMFASSKIKTIYASDKFVTNNVTESTYMFRDSTNLVGGNGTTYNSSYIDKTYARIDTASTPGYFTAK